MTPGYHLRKLPLLSPALSLPQPPPQKDYILRSLCAELMSHTSAANPAPPALPEASVFHYPRWLERAVAGPLSGVSTCSGLEPGRGLRQRRLLTRHLGPGGRGDAPLGGRKGTLGAVAAVPSQGHYRTQKPPGPREGGGGEARSCLSQVAGPEGQASRRGDSGKDPRPPANQD